MIKPMNTLEEFEPLYLDGDVYGIFARKYHVRAFPTSIIINAEGEFLHRSNANGMSTEEFLEWLKVKNWSFVILPRVSLWLTVLAVESACERFCILSGALNIILVEI